LLAVSSRVAGRSSRLLCDRQWRSARGGNSSAHLLLCEKSEAVKKLKMDDFFLTSYSQQFHQIPLVKFYD
jgi:hypothetical protein